MPFRHGLQFLRHADLPSARLAMERYLARERSGAFRKDVSELMGEMRDRVRLLPGPFGRHKAARLVQRGWRLFQNGENRGGGPGAQGELEPLPGPGRRPGYPGPHRGAAGPVRPGQGAAEPERIFHHARHVLRGPRPTGAWGKRKSAR